MRFLSVHKLAATVGGTTRLVGRTDQVGSPKLVSTTLAHNAVAARVVFCFSWVPAPYAFTRRIPFSA